MTLNQITHMLTVGQLSMDLWCANNAVTRATNAYHAKFREFEELGGSFKGVLNKDDPDHAEVIEFTRLAYAARQEARRKAAAAKRRLDNACKRAALLGVTA